MNFLLLQINDSAFPIGSYTQSYGIETYVQKNLIHDKATTKLFLENQLQYSFVYNELLTVKLAYLYAKEQNLKKLYELEQMAKSAQTPKEIRQAHQKLGNRFFKAIETMGIIFDTRFLYEYHAFVKEVGVSHSVVYGVFCACAGIDFLDTLSNYLYGQTSAHITNCVKLIPLSQTQGQQILYECHELFEKILNKLMECTEKDLFRNCVALDICCMKHETLYSRLYMS